MTQTTSSNSAFGRWTDDTLLLFLFHTKTEQYLSSSRQNLDLFWPGRPKTLFVTDGEARGEDVVCFKEGSFVELLNATVQHVIEHQSWAKHVFVLLDDLCPLAPVDEAALADIQHQFRQHGGHALSHVWSSNAGPWYKGQWDHTDRVQVGNLSMREVPKDCVFYNCLVACVWDVDHLADVIEQKLNAGIKDPWGFEQPLSDDAPKHFLVPDIWPTRPDGILRRGQLNDKLMFHRFPPSPLLSQIRKEYCGSDSRIACRLTYEMRKLPERLNLNSARFRRLDEETR